LRNAKNIMDLVRHARPNDPSPRLLINQANTPKRPEIPAKDFAETMGVEPVAVLGYDAALFGQAANNGQMIPEVSAKAPIADGLRLVARALTGRETSARPSEKAPTSILSFLTSRKRA